MIAWDERGDLVGQFVIQGIFLLACVSQKRQIQIPIELMPEIELSEEFWACDNRHFPWHLWLYFWEWQGYREMFIYKKNSSINRVICGYSVSLSAWGLAEFIWPAHLFYFFKVKHVVAVPEHCLLLKSRPLKYLFALEIVSCVVCAQMLRCVRIFATPWVVACLAHLCMEFSSQRCWSGFPFPSSGGLPDPKIEPMSTGSPDSLPLGRLRSPEIIQR